MVAAAFVIIFVVVLAVEVWIKRRRLRELYGCDPSLLYLPQVRPEITPSLREAVFTRNKLDDNLYCCSYCGQFGPHQYGPDGRLWEIDHNIPFSRGGPTVFENLYLSCHSCNMCKSVQFWPVQFPLTFSQPAAKLGGR